MEKLFQLKNTISMNINDLFEKIQDEFLPEDINGEFSLAGNVIIWSYDLDEDSEDFSMDDEDEDELSFSFESSSPEELLLEAYEEDLMKLETFLDEMEESENWSTSEPESMGKTISFKLF